MEKPADLKTRLARLTLGAANVLFPPICSVCGKKLETEDETLCKTCRDAFRELGRVVCPFCGAPAKRRVKRRCPHCPKPIAYFDSARGAFRYEGRLAEAIQAFKYEQRVELGRVLARAMFMTFLRLRNPDGGRESRQDDPAGLSGQIDAIVPVPMHYTRRWRRGYNHAEMLSREFATLARIDCIPNLIVRSRRTPRQALMSADERVANVQGAFETPNGSDLNGLRVGLFDDVLTSGSTVNECARVLREAGAAQVHVLALARA